MTDLERTYASYRRSRRKQRAWDPANRGNVEIRRELVAAVHEVAGPELRGATRVLDVGCGGGWWLEELSNEESVTAELHGIDLLEHRVAAARQRLPNAHLVVGDARHLPYPDAHFGVVCMFTVLSSARNGRDVALELAQARRALAPGGVLLVWEPRFANPFNTRTRRVTLRRLRATLGPGTQACTTTLLPLLARRLGSRTSALYPLLAHVRPLRTHRLSWLHAPSPCGTAALSPRAARPAR